MSRKKLLALIGEAKRVCAERAASAQINALHAASQKLDSSSNVSCEQFHSPSTVIRVFTYVLLLLMMTLACTQRKIRAIYKWSVI